MLRPLRIALVLQLLALCSIRAQEVPSWKVRGDTMSAPSGCSAATGIATIAAWFAAYNAADSAALDRATADQFDFSSGKFAPDTSVRAETLSALLRHARERARRHERMIVQAVTFNAWHGKALWFGPIYFLRKADGLGGTARVGIGKGAYSCGEGLQMLYLAPRPKLRPGTRMRDDQAYPAPW
jgi:hypothetical protein